MGAIKVTDGFEPGAVMAWVRSRSHGWAAPDFLSHFAGQELAVVGVAGKSAVLDDDFAAEHRH